MRLSREMYIQRLLKSVGLTYHGPGTLNSISISLSNPTTDITHIDLCVKSWGMEVTTEDAQPPLPSKRSSPSQWSSLSNPSISERSLPIYAGMAGLRISYVELVTWLTSQGVSVGSLEDETILRPSGKLLHMTLKAVSPTS